MLTSDALDRQETGARAQHAKGGLEPRTLCEQGLLGQGGCPRKAGSTPSCGSLLPPCGHGITCTDLPPSLRDPPASPPGLSPLQQRRRGQKERRRSKTVHWVLGPGTVVHCLQLFARSWHRAPQAPPPGHGGLLWGHIASQPLWGRSWGDESFTAKRELQAEGACEAHTRLAERGTPFKCSTMWSVGRDPLWGGVCFQLLILPVSLCILARARSQGPGHGQISREPDWSGPMAFGRVGRRPRENRKFWSPKR